MAVGDPAMEKILPRLPYNETVGVVEVRQPL